MFRAIFVFAIITPWLVGAVLNPFAALALYVWYAMFRPEGWVYFDLASLRLSLVFGVVLLGRSLVSGALPEVRHPLSLGILLFLAAAGLSQFGASDQVVAWNGLDSFSRLVIVSLLSISLISTPRRLLIIVAVLAGSFGFHSAKAGTASLLGGGAQLFEGLAGSFSDNNGYALGIVMILPLLFAAGQNMPKWWLRWGFYAAVPLSAFAVVSLFSRGGLLGLAGGALAFILLQRHRLPTLAAAVVIVGLALRFAPFPAGYFDRIDTIRSANDVLDDPNSASDASAGGRVHFWAVAIEMAKAHPFGVGIQNYQVQYDRYDTSNGQFGRSRAVHSIYFQILAEIGFMGTAIYLGLLAYAAMTALRIRRRALRSDCSPEMRRLFFTMANGMAASLAAFVVGGAFLAAALNDVTWLTFGVLAAMDRMSIEYCPAPIPARAGRPAESMAQARYPRSPVPAPLRTSSPKANPRWK